MTRTRFGPNRVKAPMPPMPDVSLCVVTHYTEHDWHKERMAVVQKCLDTMLDGVGRRKPELLIWDNGSIYQFRLMLKQYDPDVYVDAINVGPHNARRALCAAARADVVCITDDDVLFAPNWLDKQLEVLTTYPNVGIVAGSPMNMAFKGGVEPAFAFADRPGVRSWRGKNLLPQAWEDDYARSVGIRPSDNVRHREELLLEYKGVKAWAHGHHMQMLCYRDVIYPFLQQSDKWLLDLKEFNVRVGLAGLLQLTTFERTARHIGNVIDDEMILDPWPPFEIPALKELQHA